jgi:hypothetical protein
MSIIPPITRRSRAIERSVAFVPIVVRPRSTLSGT